MKKIVKRLVSVAVAAAMVVAMSVSTSAGTVCRHFDLVKVPVGTAAHGNSEHYFECVVNNVLTKAPCAYSWSIIKYEYKCASCGETISTAGTERIEYHSNTSCPRYSKGGTVI